MADENTGDSGIFIDSDWKSQAQAEKEKLNAEAEQAKAQSGQPKLPEASVMGLLQMLVEPALLYLGRIPEPSTGKPIVSLEAAKYYVDLLGVLTEKTKGNVTEEESQLMTGTLAQLRAEFVEGSQLVAQAIKEGKARTVSPEGGATMGSGGESTGGIITP